VRLLGALSGETLLVADGARLRGFWKPSLLAELGELAAPVDFTLEQQGLREVVRITSVDLPAGQLEVPTSSWDRENLAQLSAQLAQAISAHAEPAHAVEAEAATEPPGEASATAPSLPGIVGAEPEATASLNSAQAELLTLLARRVQNPSELASLRSVFLGLLTTQLESNDHASDQALVVELRALHEGANAKEREMLAVAIELCRREQIEALLEYLAQSRERTSVPLRLAWAHAMRFYGDPSKVTGAFERALDVGAPNELCQPFISAPPRQKKKRKPKGKLAEQQQPRSDARDHEVSENSAREAPDSSDRNWMLLLLVALVAAVIHHLSC
jgi:hypothetical protein